MASFGPTILSPKVETSFFRLFQPWGKRRKRGRTIWTGSWHRKTWIVKRSLATWILLGKQLHMYTYTHTHTFIFLNYMERYSYTSVDRPTTNSSKAGYCQQQWPWVSISGFWPQRWKAGTFWVLGVKTGPDHRCLILSVHHPLFVYPIWIATKMTRRSIEFLAMCQVFLEQCQEYDWVGVVVRSNGHGQERRAVLGRDASWMLGGMRGLAHRSFTGMGLEVLGFFGAPSHGWGHRFNKKALPQCKRCLRLCEREEVLYLDAGHGMFAGFSHGPGFGGDRQVSIPPFLVFWRNSHGFVPCRNRVLRRMTFRPCSMSWTPTILERHLCGCHNSPLYCANGLWVCFYIRDQTMAKTRITFWWFQGPQCWEWPV